MSSPVLLVPWLLLGVPVVSVFKWLELRRKRNADYAFHVELKEFPILKITLGKLVFFGLLGIASLVYTIPIDKTVVALGLLGVCGYYIEATIAIGRPVPTPGYRMAKQVCQKCGQGEHDDCTNLRMLDGFESGFRSADGYRRPVCCCGFRLGKWEEAAA
jgi:hypothetical protein